jgi:hypothetical protein
VVTEKGFYVKVWSNCVIWNFLDAFSIIFMDFMVVCGAFSDFLGVFSWELLLDTLQADTKNQDIKPNFPNTFS